MNLPPPQRVGARGITRDRGGDDPLAPNADRRPAVGQSEDGGSDASASSSGLWA